MKIKPIAGSANIQHVLQLGGNKVVQAMFGDRQQTKLGGAPVLLQLELTQQLVSGAAACLRDWRVPGQVKYSLFQLLWQRVVLICCGYEDCIDAALLSHEPGLLLVLGIGPDGNSNGPASQPTVCRFENKMSAANCYRLAAWLLYAYIVQKKRPPKSLRLDFDGSCIPTYGRQQGSSYRSYYATNMYFPLFVFDEDGELITAILRPGEHGEAKMTLPVLKRLVLAFRAAWPAVEITVVIQLPGLFTQSSSALDACIGTTPALGIEKLASRFSAKNDACFYTRALLAYSGNRGGESKSFQPDLVQHISAQEPHARPVHTPDTWAENYPQLAVHIRPIPHVIDYQKDTCCLGLSAVL